MYFSAYIKVVRDKASRTGRLVEIFFVHRTAILRRPEIIEISECFCLNLLEYRKVR